MVSVRAATAADLPVIMEIAGHAATAAQWSPELYKSMFHSHDAPQRLTLVVEQHSRVAGFVVARESAGEWEIENLAVSGEVRRRGFGSHLVRVLLQLIRNNGGQNIFLEVRESNHAARLLYEKLAFVESGRRKQYYQDPCEDALILRLSFPQ